MNAGSGMVTGVQKLQWPLGWPRTVVRSVARFDRNRSFYASQRAIEEEVRRLGGTHLIVSSNLQLRRDGLPYSQQRQPGDPGVAVYFKLKGEPVVFACDQYDRVEDSLYAIAKTIEAKRGILRWGCATGTREFTGYAALPADVQAGRASLDPPIREVLGVPATASLDTIKEAYRKWLLDVHPDRNHATDKDRFIRLKGQAERLIEELTPP